MASAWRFPRLARPGAELGAAFLCVDLGLTPEVCEDHAAYIATWITVLGNDTRGDIQRRRSCAARRGLSAKPAAEADWGRMAAA
jgi:antirestriction protein ArdC